MKSRKCKMPRLCMQRGEPNESTDQYYQQMIKDNPGNALLLGNYAKFLKEVKGDFYKAEEYCKRAIQTKDEDGDIHSLYGELIWLIDNDITRAEAHFHQAVLAQPSDRYDVKQAMDKKD
ncbi:Transmembrane and TPR repeat-containing protein 1, partial [Bienertia sinuspersici]